MSSKPKQDSSYVESIAAAISEAVGYEVKAPGDHPIDTEIGAKIRIGFFPEPASIREAEGLPPGPEAK